MGVTISGNIVDVVSGKILKNRVVEINNGIITDILDNLERFGDTSENDNYLIPGLIDSHLHLLFSGSGTPLQDFRDLDQEGLYQLALRNTQMALEYGITTVRDCGSLSDITFKLREDINIGKVIGARVLTSGEVVTTRGGHLNFMGIEADTPEEMNKAAEFILDKGADFIKLIVSGGNTTPGSKDNVDQYEYENIKSITVPSFSLTSLGVLLLLISSPTIFFLGLDNLVPSSSSSRQAYRFRPVEIKEEDIASLSHKISSSLALHSLAISVAIS